MLCITRKAGEKIQLGPDILGPDILVTVLEVRGRYVRLGFVAPPAVRIVRTELLTDAAGGTSGDGLAPDAR